MPTVKDIYGFLEKIAPFEAAMEWDNSGLLAGDINREVNKILFALDITSAVVNEAVKINADLIISHHPIIFKPIKRIEYGSPLDLLLKNDLPIICAHTNYDLANNGVNDILCHVLGFNTFKKYGTECFNLVKCEAPFDCDTLAVYVKNKLNAAVRYNKTDSKIRKIAVCCGAGSDYLSLARDLGCNALITGDGSHHDFLDAAEYGISLICAGHFETEIPAVEFLADLICNLFGLECVIAEQESPIITI